MCISCANRSLVEVEMLASARSKDTEFYGFKKLWNCLYIVFTLMYDQWYINIPVLHIKG